MSAQPNRTNSVLRVIIFILMLGVSFSIGKRVGITQEHSNSVANVLAYKAQNLEKQQILEEDLLLCHQNRGRKIENHTEPYSFETFGVYSPLFEGKDAEVVTYNYLGAEVIHKTILLGDTLVRVHYVSTPEKYTKGFFADSGYFSTNEIKDIPTFSAYENYALNPTFISDYAKQWDSKKSYINKTGMQAHIIDYHVPGQAAIAGQMYTPYSPLGTPLFIEVIENYDPGMVIDNPVTKKAAESDLKAILDTIEVKL